MQIVRQGDRRAWELFQVHAQETDATAVDRRATHWTYAGQPDAVATTFLLRTAGAEPWGAVVRELRRPLFAFWGSTRCATGRCRQVTLENSRCPMLSYALLFLIIALVAGLFGFGLIGGMSYMAAKICFFVFLVLFVISLFTGRRTPVA